MDEVDFTILSAKSVFTDMIDKCPPAEACRDAFDRTARATIKMANVNGGFGPHTRRKLKQNGPLREGPVMDWQSSSGSPSTASASNQTSRTIGLEAETLSSPAMSADKEAPMSPRLPRVRSYEDGYGAAGLRSRAAAGNVETGAQAQAQEVSPIDPALLATGNLAPGSAGQQTGTYLPPQGFQPSPEMPDLQNMEFMQSLQGGAPSGDLGSLDPLGFGLSWDAGLNQDLEGQQVNLFDGFFFGGQGQGTQGGGGE